MRLPYLPTPKQLQQPTPLWVCVGAVMQQQQQQQQ
jgi:hypothetical protein